MIEKAPILITGCPRSGTSAIAAVINKCGAFVGDITKRGMYSNEAIKEMVVKPYLYKIGVDMDGQFPLPETYGLTIPTDWHNIIGDIMQMEGYRQGEWMYKDHRSALIWPVWNKNFPNAKWIIVRRRTGDIIQSCIKTGFMIAFKNEFNIEKTNSTSEDSAWLWYVRQYERRFVEMINNGLNCKILWPERLIDNDYEQLYELLDWLGLKWNPKAMKLIESLLWKSNIVRERRIIHGTCHTDRSEGNNG
jgi:hypothetical protein